MTKVQTSKFLAICNKLGLTVVAQPSQYRVSGKDVNQRFYIPGTKAVHKIELSGWTHELAVEWAKVFPGKKAPSGKITHVVNFDQPEKAILKDFFKMAKSQVAKAAKPAPAPVADPAQSTDIPGQTTEEIAPPVEMPVAG